MSNQHRHDLGVVPLRSLISNVGVFPTNIIKVSLLYRSPMLKEGVARSIMKLFLLFIKVQNHISVKNKSKSPNEDLR